MYVVCFADLPETGPGGVRRSATVQSRNVGCAPPAECRCGRRVAGDSARVALGHGQRVVERHSLSGATRRRVARHSRRGGLAARLRAARPTVATHPPEPDSALRSLTFCFFFFGSGY